jgi:hypothetical protein
LIGVAVKVTELPEQTGFADAAIVTLTGKFALTVMVIVLDVAGVPVAQPAFDVMMQETVLPSDNAPFV